MPEHSTHNGLNEPKKWGITLQHPQDYVLKHFLQQLPFLYVLHASRPELHIQTVCIGIFFNKKVCCLGFTLQSVVL